MKAQYTSGIIVAMMYILQVCDYDTELATEVFMDAVENLGLFGKRIGIEETTAIIRYVENIIKTECQDEGTK